MSWLVYDVAVTVVFNVVIYAAIAVVFGTVFTVGLVVCGS